MPVHDFTAAEVPTSSNVDAYLNNSYYCQLRQPVSQNLLDSTFAAITFTTEDFDTDNAHDTGSNTSRFTCQTAGIYFFNGSLAIGASPTGQRYLQWAKNGSVVNGSGVRATGASNGNAAVAKPMFISLAVSDYVELWAHQNSGGTLATSTSTDMQSTMTVWRVSS